MAAGGGGAWKVAYADFVTAMMAFFLVMWITAQSNAVKQSISHYFEHPYDAASRSPIPSKSSSGSSLIPLNHEMEAPLPKSNMKGKSLKGGGMIANHEPPPNDPDNVPKSGGLRRRSGFMLRDAEQSGLGNVVWFSGDSSELDQQSKETLDELLPAFSGKFNKIEIRGHAPQALDAKSPNSSEIWKLSYDRCLAVMNYLVEHGIERQRIRLSQAGAFEPPPSDLDPAIASGPKSRVEIYLLPEYVDEYFHAGKPDAETTTSAPAEPKPVD